VLAAIYNVDENQTNEWFTNNDKLLEWATVLELPSDTLFHAVRAITKVRHYTEYPFSIYFQFKISKNQKIKKKITFSLHLPSPTTLGLAHQSH